MRQQRCVGIVDAAENADVSSKAGRGGDIGPDRREAPIGRLQRRHQPAQMERRFPDEVRRDLAGRGHPVNTVGDLEGPCSVEIIRRDSATGMLLAGSDPRRDGWALAW